MVIDGREKFGNKFIQYAKETLTPAQTEQRFKMMGKDFTGMVAAAIKRIEESQKKESPED